MKTKRGIDDVSPTRDTTEDPKGKKAKKGDGNGGEEGVMVHRKKMEQDQERLALQAKAQSFADILSDSEHSEGEDKPKRTRESRKSLMSEISAGMAKITELRTDLQQAFEKDVSSESPNFEGHITGIIAIHNELRYAKKVAGEAMGKLEKRRFTPDTQQTFEDIKSKFREFIEDDGTDAKVREFIMKPIDDNRTKLSELDRSLSNDTTTSMGSRAIGYGDLTRRVDENLTAYYSTKRQILDYIAVLGGLSDDNNIQDAIKIKRDNINANGSKEAEFDKRSYQLKRGLTTGVDINLDEMSRLRNNLNRDMNNTTRFSDSHFVERYERQWNRFLELGKEIRDNIAYLKKIGSKFCTDSELETYQTRVDENGKNEANYATSLIDMQNPQSGTAGVESSRR